MHFSGTLLGSRIVSAFSTAASRAFVCAILILGAGCGTTDPEVERPSRPRWECPTPAFSPEERGTGVSPGGQTITLRWHIGSEPDLAGYQIYRRIGDDVADTLIAIRELTEDELADRSTIIEWDDEFRHPTPIPSYYVLFAYNNDDVRSFRSDTMGFMVLPIPQLRTPYANAVVKEPIPQFTFHPDVFSANSTAFVVRVRSYETEEVLWVSNRRALTGLTWNEYQFITYGLIGDEGYLSAPTLPSGTYEWRVDFLGTHRLLRPLEAAPCRCISDTFGCAEPGVSRPRLQQLEFARSASEWRPFIVDVN